VPNHSVHKAIDLAHDERLLVERWLGRALANDETISVNASSSHSALAEDRLPSAPLRAGNFFVGKSLSDLALAQGVQPMNDLSQMAGGFPADENIDEFLTDIYTARE
jgi:hypothetical protein